jgi:hypothetical protein
MWPFFDLEEEEKNPQAVRETLNRAEYTVFQQVIEASTFGAVLNEGGISETEPIALPSSVRVRIVPDDIFHQRSHPDVRIARRAATIADLARQMSERSVSLGLRRTLVVQAKRLEHLTERRLSDFHAPEEQ